MSKLYEKKKIVKITWIDSASLDGWSSEEYALERTGLAEIDTIGYFVREDKTEITVCLSYDRTNSSVLSCLTIPKKCIIKRN